ncbi:MAG: hypothetical protein IJX13_04830, partial [Clostridia bacterium]|nr:hypothetical protein [Clostridia bacterium]
DLQMVAIVMESMNWLSNSDGEGAMDEDERVLPVYYGTVLQGQIAESPDDYRMLDLIRNSIRFDFGYQLDGQIKMANNVYKVVINGRNLGAELTEINAFAEAGLTDLREFYNK